MDNPNSIEDLRSRRVARFESSKPILIPSSDVDDDVEVETVSSSPIAPRLDGDTRATGGYRKRPLVISDDEQFDDVAVVPRRSTPSNSIGYLPREKQAHASQLQNDPQVRAIRVRGAKFRDTSRPKTNNSFGPRDKDNSLSKVKDQASGRLAPQPDDDIALKLLAILHETEGILQDTHFLSRHPPGDGKYFLNPFMVCISHLDARAYTLAAFLRNYGGARRPIGSEPKIISVEGHGCERHETKREITTTLPLLMSLHKNDSSQAVINFMSARQTGIQFAKAMEKEEVQLCHHSDCILGDDLGRWGGIIQSLGRDLCKHYCDPDASEWPWECGIPSHDPPCKLAKAMIGLWERRLMEWMAANEYRTLTEIPMAMVGNLSPEDLQQPFYSYSWDIVTVRRLESHTLAEVFGDETLNTVVSHGLAGPSRPS